MKVLAMLVLVAVSTFLVLGQTTTDASSDSSTAPADITDIATDYNEVTEDSDIDEDTTEASDTRTGTGGLPRLEKLLFP
uniref:Secreted protein n=1 Tax=Mustela putorius furo TaxID=9669 RepID=M3Y2E0_MUSPF